MELARRGEEVAAEHYRARGYRILARNWRGTNGELDLVATRGRDLVVCEVKTRSSTVAGLPEESVTDRKLRRMRALVAEYLERTRNDKHPGNATETYATVRFDVVSVIFEGSRPPRVEIFEDVL